MPSTLYMRSADVLPLWCLLDRTRYADTDMQAFGCLLSKAYQYGGRERPGLLLFTSPAHAQIYCERLREIGDCGWQCARTSAAEVRRILGRLGDEPLALWIAVGFCATDGWQLLLDGERALMTSSLGLDAGLARSADGKEAVLSLPSETAALLRELVFDDAEHAAAPGWSEYALEALAQVSVTEQAEDAEMKGGPGPFRIALFDAMTGKWKFRSNAALRRH